MRWVFRAGALGRPRGMGWRGRQEGGSGWGTHVNPWLIHVNVWQKPLQYCKVISLQRIKINGKKIGHHLTQNTMVVGQLRIRSHCRGRELSEGTRADDRHEEDKGKGVERDKIYKIHHL